MRLSARGTAFGTVKIHLSTLASLLFAYSNVEVMKETLFLSAIVFLAYCSLTNEIQFCQ